MKHTKPIIIWCIVLAVLITVITICGRYLHITKELQEPKPSFVITIPPGDGTQTFDEHGQVVHDKPEEV